jgi:hypothetical protein
MTVTQPLIVLGIDPGTTNFAFCFLEARSQRVLHTACTNICPSGLQTYRSIAIGVKVLLDRLYNARPFHHVSVEMQLREAMIAVMQSVLMWCACRDVHSEVVHASIWRSRVGLRATGNYEKNKKKSILYLDQIYGYRTKDHNLAEATLIALGAASALGLVEYC